MQIGCQLRDVLLPLLLAEEMLEREVEVSIGPTVLDCDDEATLKGDDDRFRVEVRHVSTLLLPKFDQG